MPTEYKIHLDERFGPLELVDLKQVIDACDDPWFNQTLCKVNDSVVRLGILQGEFHWHKHDNEDESLNFTVVPTLTEYPTTQWPTRPFHWRPVVSAKRCGRTPGGFSPLRPSQS